MTAAAGGWSIPNEAAWLEEHGTAGASLILLQINEQDLNQPFVDGAILDHHVSFPSRPPLTAIGEVIDRYVLPRLGLSNSADPGSTGGASAGDNHVAVNAAIEQLIAHGKRAGAEVKVVYWDLRRPAPAAAAALRDDLLARLRDQGVDVIRPALNRMPNSERYFRDMIHPNVAGNAVFAQAIAQALD